MARQTRQHSPVSASFVSRHASARVRSRGGRSRLRLHRSFRRGKSRRRRDYRSRNGRRLSRRHRRKSVGSSEDGRASSLSGGAAIAGNGKSIERQGRKSRLDEFVACYLQNKENRRNVYERRTLCRALLVRSCSRCLPVYQEFLLTLSSVSRLGRPTANDGREGQDQIDVS